MTPPTPHSIWAENHDSSLHRSSIGGAESSEEYELLSERNTQEVTGRSRNTPERSWRDGHRFGLLCCTISTAVVLLINVILCIVASAKNEVAGSFATLYDGHCDKVKRLDLWLHLLINVLSTMLLGASNYCMQCLAAPTREDIDKAHGQSGWMDVGVPSVRNLRRISRSRRISWCCLLLSSVPLHLVYNSVIVASTSIAEPLVYLVTNNFLADPPGAPYDVSETDYDYLNPDIRDDGAVAEITARLQRLQQSASTVRLETAECQKAYGGSTLISKWGDALAVTTADSNDTSLLFMSGESYYDKIMCNAILTCEGSSLRFERSLLDVSISHCMALKASQHCELRFSVGLMMGVIACNLIKIICMSCAVWKLDHRLLVTLGDAIESFLETPGQSTSPLMSLKLSNTARCRFARITTSKWKFRPTSKLSSTNMRNLQILLPKANA